MTKLSTRRRYRREVSVHQEYFKDAEALNVIKADVHLRFPSISRISVSLSAL